jgi:putative ubiquitin-RnfH superfamily antitoxin RatB of RatAB toxin-antitoxin module
MTSVTISVVYAEALRQTQVSLEVPVGTTVAEAIALAQLAHRHPDLPSDLSMGVWGREVSADTPVAMGDRVELYRPLPQDPKETRRALARQGRSMGGAVGMKSRMTVRRPRAKR